MGDSGSLLLGFSLGVVSLFAVARSALFVSLLVPLLAAGVPIIDTAVAIIRRLRAHEPIDQADRGHIHHRLMQAGFSQRATVLIMWGWTAALSACAVLITELHGAWRIVVFLVVAALTAFGIVKLRLLQPVLLHHYNPRSRGKRGAQQQGAQPEDPAEDDGKPRSRARFDAECLAPHTPSPAAAAAWVVAGRSCGGLNRVAGGQPNKGDFVAGRQ